MARVKGEGVRGLVLSWLRGKRTSKEAERERGGGEDGIYVKTSVVIPRYVSEVCTSCLSLRGGNLKKMRRKTKIDKVLSEIMLTLAMSILCRKLQGG